MQLEPGSTPTEFEVFVPNSPSPDYPSAITSNIPAGIYQLTSPITNKIYEVTMPDTICVV